MILYTHPLLLTDLYNTFEKGNFFECGFTIYLRRGYRIIILAETVIVLSVCIIIKIVSKHSPVTTFVESYTFEAWNVRRVKYFAIWFQLISKKSTPDDPPYHPPANFEPWLPLSPNYAFPSLNMSISQYTSLSTSNLT